MSFKFSMKNLTLRIVLLMIVISCENENRIEREIADIGIDITTERFDLHLAKTDLKALPKLKQVYPFMFSKKYKDSFWIAKITDTLQLKLFYEVDKAFSNFSDTEKEIESLFNHLKYYYSEFSPPRVITTTSDVDYRNSVFVTDTVTVIGLDNYLGSTHEFYGGIPKYLRGNFRQEQIVVDLATAYSKKYIYQQQRKTLLDEMIYFGKQLYFKDVVIPFKTDAQRIGYSQKQLDWAITNESYIWRYFIERELLFSTDSKLPLRFINAAPFSKFYLEEIDADSPGKLGQYIGWQIIRAYMSQNEVSLKDMLKAKTEDIFNNTKFKPRK